MIRHIGETQDIRKALVGGKAFHLNNLKSQGLPVPSGSLSIMTILQMTL